ncbi:hypothetical protein LX87_04637 [Larkinella arboricola]|uniref:Uncharacterized protein n=1 Tax=Larkinella arboricola TaxID=643671 RepID=A0A327WNE7_LARAB|nr:hypothetical protein LX87_04637 [Larkinella arboricola]
MIRILLLLITEQNLRKMSKGGKIYMVLSMHLSIGINTVY